MKRSVLILGIAMITLLSTGDLTAQRSRSQSGDRADRGRTEARNDRGRREARDDRSRGSRNRDGYRNVNNRNNRGTYRGNDHGNRYRNGRSERVVSNRVVRYDGYRNYGYPSRRASSIIYDYDFRNGRRYRIERRARPSRGHIWVGGHWRFSNRLQRDIWVDGCWVVKARHHRWADGHYERFRGRRIWVDGCWTRTY